MECTYAEQVQVMAVQCLSQQVQVNMLIALDLRQSQHCEGCVTALRNLSRRRTICKGADTRQRYKKRDSR